MPLPPLPLLLAAGDARRAPVEPRAPDGTLVAVGGAEDKEEDMVVLRRTLDLVAKKAKRVEIIPSASSEPDKAAEPYLDAFHDLGIQNVEVMDVRTRQDAEREDWLERIEDADIVYFTGGDQLRLSSTLGGTPLLDAIHKTYLDGGIVAGTSAGAAAMSATMIAHGAARAGSLRKGNIQMTPGLGLLPGVIIDTHFTERGRFSRLVEAISANPGLLGVGISEDTGIIVRNGRTLEVIGRSLVIIVDGQDIRHTNVANATSDEPVSVERMIVHTLGERYRYDLETRAYETPKRRPHAAE